MLHRKRTLTWYFLKMLVSVAKKVPTFSKKGVARISHSGIISPCRSARGAEANHWMWAFSSGGERFPDTEEVTSSNLVTPTMQLQARGNNLPSGFYIARKSSWKEIFKLGLASIRKLSYHTSSRCGHGSAGRASPCQGEGREFEPRFPLHLIYRDDVAMLHGKNGLLSR